MHLCDQKSFAPEDAWSTTPGEYVALMDFNRFQHRRALPKNPAQLVVDFVAHLERIGAL